MEGEHWEGWVCFPGSPGQCLKPCLPMGSGEWIPAFPLLAHTAFAFPIKLPPAQPTGFLSSLILSPIPAAAWGWDWSTPGKTKHLSRGAPPEFVPHPPRQLRWEGAWTGTRLRAGF